MSQTLTDLFEARGSNSVVWQGRQVMALVEIPIGPGDRIRVRRLGSSLVRAQAVKLAVDRGAITVGGYSGPVVALWSHTAPADLLLQIDGPATAIQVWNAWSLDGVDNSWLGNAGIMVDDHGGGLTLQCSDGVGEPDFSDLVVWVSVTSSRPAAPAAPEAKATPQTPEAKSTSQASEKASSPAPPAQTPTAATPPQKRQGAPRTSPIAKTSAPPSAKPPSLTPRPAPNREVEGQTDTTSQPNQKDRADTSSANGPAVRPSGADAPGPSEAGSNGHAAETAPHQAPQKPLGEADQNRPSSGSPDSTTDEKPATDRDDDSPTETHDEVAD